MNFIDNNIVPLCELITKILLYSLCVLGILTVLIFILSPIAMAYYGLSGIKIKLKKYKQQKKDKIVKNIQDGNRDMYMSQLQNVVYRKSNKKKKK